MRREQLYFSLLVFFIHHQVYSYQILPTPSCPNNQTTYSCQTYVFYRGRAPDILDLATISDLFGVSRLMISKASNITTPTAPLVPDQSLLIPITCSCNPNQNFSYSNITYSIKPGDTFFQVSNRQFQNLTTYQAVELLNPTFIPTLLHVGDNIIFPIFCKCPNSTQLLNITYLISYVFQPFDNLSSVAAKFNSSIDSVIDVNGKNIHPMDTIYIPVSRIPEFTQPFIPPLSPLRPVEKKKIIIGLSIGLGISGASLIILSPILGIWYFRESIKKSEKKKDEKSQSQRYKFSRMKSSIEEENLMADVSDCLDKYRVYGIREIREATSGFAPSSLIQGSVYKGCINGEFYAIKKMKWNACEELKILQKVNHGSLVRLEGFCIDPDDGNCFLVYEYIENGSLHSWLHQERLNKKKLDWKTRLKIAIDVANGLQYIHEHTRPKVVHKDLKTSNILLDGNMRAKIANFGLAKSGCNAITMHIVGTQGYIAPEYVSDGIISTKMDVFAFGVILLELISGREALNVEGKVLWLNVEKILEGGEEVKQLRLKEWIDEVLIEENCSMDAVMNVMSVAIACLQKDPCRRPGMVDIVYTLCKSDDFYFDFSEDGLSVTQVSAR